MATDCARCGDLIPEKRQKSKAKFCADICRMRAAEERKQMKKEGAGEPAPAAQPAEETEGSIYSAEIDELRAAKARHEDEVAEAIAAEPKKRGNKSWLVQKGNKLFKRDKLAVVGMENGRHPKDPTGYYTWSRDDKVQEKLGRNYTFASRRKLGVGVAQYHAGTGTGTNPDQIWVDNLVLLRQPLQQRQEKDEYLALLTEAQTPDMEDAAQRLGFENKGDASMMRKPRAGWFGKGEIQKQAYRRAQREAGE